jgi:hypothetical protein
MGEGKGIEAVPGELERKPKVPVLQWAAIALSAGLGCLRCFDALFAEVYGCPPSELWRAKRLPLPFPSNVWK